MDTRYFLGGIHLTGELWMTAKKESRFLSDKVQDGLWYVFATKLSEVALVLYAHHETIRLETIDWETTTPLSWRSSFPVHTISSNPIERNKKPIASIHLSTIVLLHPRSISFVIDEQQIIAYRELKLDKSTLAFTLLFTYPTETGSNQVSSSR
jgi:hypothetical protein